MAPEGGRMLIPPEWGDERGDVAVGVEDDLTQYRSLNTSNFTFYLVLS